MKKDIKFKPFRKLADYNYGVKGFEVHFQEMIEEYLNANGINAPWWDYYNGSIFWELLAIYKRNEKEGEHMILCYLDDYYKKVTTEVAERVANNRPVTREEREEQYKKECQIIEKVSNHD